MVKNPPASAGDAETSGSVPSWGRALEKEMATHSSVLAWDNSMDRGAWWAMVLGVTKSQT